MAVPSTSKGYCTSNFAAPPYCGGLRTVGADRRGGLTDALFRLGSLCSAVGRPRCPAAPLFPALDIHIQPRKIMLLLGGAPNQLAGVCIPTERLLFCLLAHQLGPGKSGPTSASHAGTCASLLAIIQSIAKSRRRPTKGWRSLAAASARVYVPLLGARSSPSAQEGRAHGRCAAHNQAYLGNGRLVSGRQRGQRDLGRVVGQQKGGWGGLPALMRRLQQAVEVGG